MDRDTFKAFKRILTEQLQQILSDFNDQAFAADNRNSSEPMDEADLACARSEREWSLTLRQRNSRAVKEILDALQRLKGGQFGICEECGLPIGLMRLKAHPTASVCIDCKKELEAEERKILFQKAC